MVPDHLVKIYEGQSKIFSDSWNNNMNLNHVHVKESQAIQDTKWEFPIQCEKQLHYHLIKSLPFLSCLQLNVVIAPNKT